MSPTRASTAKSRSKSKASQVPATPARPFIANQLVPPHELLSEAESAETLRTLATLTERLPKILVTDPGLKTDPKYLAAREAHEPMAGRLVRIRRPSATAGESIAYRVLTDHAGE